MNLVKKLIESNLIKTGDFTLKSGKKSAIYFDFKGLLQFPRLVLEISYELSKFISDDELIAGVPIGGIPYATNISWIKKLPFTIVRKDKKQYGLNKLIECDSFSTITLIEDVITTGQSIIEIINLIENNGIRIKKIICILDREEGGTEQLKKAGYCVQSLFKPTDFVIQKPIERLIVMNNITKKLIEIINSKKTNLVVSLDMDSGKDILSAIRLICNYVCAIKLHMDIIKDWTTQFTEELLTLKNCMNFLIIEDRKFADIGHISCKQFEKLEPFVDIVTVHGICGESQISCLNNFIVGLLLVHQLSIGDNLIDEIYSCRVRDMAIKYQNVIGFISQDNVLPNYLTFTPGISLEKKYDGKGQIYRTINDCNSDIFIVGRSIFDSDDIQTTTLQYRNQAFKKWNQLNQCTKITDLKTSKL